MSSKRFDKNSFRYVKLTKTKSCEGCACTRYLYGTGGQAGAKYMAGNTSPFSTIRGSINNAFSTCDMGFAVMEFDIFNNNEWLEFPVPLEPCTKPTGKQYCINRLSDELQNGRRSPQELIQKFLIEKEYGPALQKLAIDAVSKRKSMLPLTSERMLEKLSNPTSVIVGGRKFYFQRHG